MEQMKLEGEKKSKRVAAFTKKKKEAKRAFQAKKLC